MKIVDKAILLEMALDCEPNIKLYPEHNEEYYKECIENLRKKGIEIK